MAAGITQRVALQSGTGEFGATNGASGLPRAKGRRILGGGSISAFMNGKILLDVLSDHVAPFCNFEELSPKRLGKIVGELAKLDGMTVQVIDPMSHGSDVAHGVKHRTNTAANLHRFGPVFRP